MAKNKPKSERQIKREAKIAKRKPDTEVQVKTEAMADDERLTEAIRLLEIGKTMKAAAVSVGRDPSWLWRRMREDAINAPRIARARRVGYDLLSDEILEIADSADSESPGAVNKARLQTDVRKWLLSKRLPQQYGDKITLAGDADNPLQVNVLELTTDQIRQRLASIISESDASR